MTERTLIKKLKALHAIQPDEHFARTSRYLILEGAEWAAAPRINTLRRSVSFVFSVALAAVFVLVLVLGSTTGFYKNLFLPKLESVGGQALATEADTIAKDIDIRLKEIEYFEASDSVALAGEEIRTDLKDEARGEDEIDELLEEVIAY